MPRVVAICRISPGGSGDSLEVQANQCMLGAERLGLPTPEILKEPLHTSGRTVKFRDRPVGRELWHQLDKNSIMLVSKLDRLGRNIRDVIETLNHFHDRGVRVIILDLFGGQGIDLQGPIGQVVVCIMAAVAEMEGKAISVRTSEKLQWKKQQGQLAGTIPWGHKKIPIPGQKTAKGHQAYRVIWDMEFLATMSEIVHRYRMGEYLVDLLTEFNAKTVDYTGKPFCTQICRKTKQPYPCSHKYPQDRLSEWVKRFLEHYRNGELPAPYGIPGQENPIDRGLQTIGLTYVGTEDFKAYNRKAPAWQTLRPKTNEDRANWSAEEWMEWWQSQQVTSPADACPAPSAGSSASSAACPS